MIPADLAALVARWEQQAAAIQAEPAKTKAAKASRDARAAQLLANAAQLREIITPQAVKVAQRKKHIVAPVLMHRKFLTRAAEYGIAPAYLARCLCDQFALKDPTDELTINVQTNHGPWNVTYNRTVDDSKLILADHAPVSNVVANLGEQKRKT